MIVGDQSLIAIESVITYAYERLSFRALGLFVIHVKGCRYGVYEPDASMLAASFDEVGQRIVGRGTHTAPYSKEPDAHQIATSFREVLYTGATKSTYFGTPESEFASTIITNRIVWAPDGDEAFDDGSYVLQFDVNDQVRIVAFTCDPDRRKPVL